MDERFGVFSIETLERRQMLAGQVTATVVDGRLFIEGDDAANSIVLDRSPSEEADHKIIRIRGVNSTAINGHDAYIATDVIGGISIELAGGNDVLTISNLRPKGSLSVALGAGDDRALLRKIQTTGNITLDGGANFDDITIRDSVVHGNLEGSGGADRDRLTVSRVSVKGDFDWSDAGGATTMYVNRLSIHQNASIKTGNSIDHLFLESSTFFHDANVTTEGRNDQVKVRGTVFHGESDIDGGAGTNDIDREVILSWDFRDGAQGWTAGFADYPAGQTTSSDGTSAEEFYGLESGLKPLPKELGISGTGFYLAGSNHSDALSMYLAQRLSIRNGLLPGSTYDASYKIKFASHVPAGISGLGGSPAIGIGTVVAPQAFELVVDPSQKNNTAIRNYVLNVDFAKAATRLGDIANGGPPITTDIYRIVTRKGPNASPVTTDPKGNLSLAFGTFHSGNEGRTSLYYMSVAATFTPHNRKESQ
jgi:hypothetical protein